MTCGRNLKLRNGGFVIAFVVGKIFAAVCAIPIFGVPVLRAGSSLSSNINDTMRVSVTATLFKVITFVSRAGRNTKSESSRCHNSKEDNKKFFLHKKSLLIMYNEIQYKKSVPSTEDTPCKYISDCCHTSSKTYGK